MYSTVLIIITVIQTRMKYLLQCKPCCQFESLLAKVKMKKLRIIIADLKN